MATHRVKLRMWNLKDYALDLDRIQSVKKYILETVKF